MDYKETIFLDCLQVLSLDATRVLCYFLDCHPDYRTFKNACFMLNLKERTAKTVFKELQAKEFIFQWADSARHIYKLCCYPSSIHELLVNKFAAQNNGDYSLGFKIDFSGLDAQNIRTIQTVRYNSLEQQSSGLTPASYLLKQVYKVALIPLTNLVTNHKDEAYISYNTNIDVYIPTFNIAAIADYLKLSVRTINTFNAYIIDAYKFSPTKIGQGLDTSLMLNLMHFVGTINADCLGLANIYRSAYISYFGEAAEACEYRFFSSTVDKFDCLELFKKDALSFFLPQLSNALKVRNVCPNYFFKGFISLPKRHISSYWSLENIYYNLSLIIAQIKTLA